MKPCEEQTLTAPDTAWTDEEIISAEMTPDTDFVFERMTAETLAAVDARPGEAVLDVACGRAVDALALAKSGARTVGIEASGHMIEKALEFAGPNGGVTLLRSLAESLPFPDSTFDKVVCKGAMDHFVDIEKSMEEMARVAKPGGRVVIAVANFESLTCRMGKAVWAVRGGLFNSRPERAFWEPPDDHNFKFDLEVLTELMAPHCTIESIRGISLMWGYPGWGGTLSRMSPRNAGLVLKALDAAAREFPALSDVLVARGQPRK